MRAGQILAFTPLATSSLINALSDHLLPKRGLTSCSLHSLDLGASALSLKDSSYELEHCHNTGRKEKKDASDLSPYPPELVPFQPVDGADTRYGQLYKPISTHSFKEARIKGFSLIQPYKVTMHLAITDQCLAF
jgi:hypothetical protein